MQKARVKSNELADLIIENRNDIRRELLKKLILAAASVAIFILNKESIESIKNTLIFFMATVTVLDFIFSFFKKRNMLNRIYDIFETMNSIDNNTSRRDKD